MEAGMRGASNPSELWAALDAIDGRSPRLIVDIDSEPAARWAWWSLGAQVIGVGEESGASAFAGGRLPEVVTTIAADARERDTALRVRDQAAGRPVDVLVLDAGNGDVRFLFDAYAPMVRPGGLLLVHGVADPFRPAVKQFWRDLPLEGKKRFVGGDRPCGYGVVDMQRKDVATHGR